MTTASFLDEEFAARKSAVEALEALREAVLAVSRVSDDEAEHAAFAAVELGVRMTSGLICYEWADEEVNAAVERMSRKALAEQRDALYAYGAPLWTWTHPAAGAFSCFENAETSFFSGHKVTHYRQAAQSARYAASMLAETFAVVAL